VFLDVKGDKTRSIGLIGNDFRKAKVPFQTTSGARNTEIAAVNNLGTAK
jgi:hypothetical protein